MISSLFIYYSFLSLVFVVFIVRDERANYLTASGDELLSPCSETFKRSRRKTQEEEEKEKEGKEQEQ